MIISTRLEKNLLSSDKVKKRVIYLVIFSLIVFAGRNINRISKEYNKYNYKPLKNIFYKFDESYFELNIKMKRLKKNYDSCELEKINCEINERYGVQKIGNFYVFYLNK